MIAKLEIYGSCLSGICYIEGIGLSSNVYTVGTNDITVVDTGVGDHMNALPPKLKTLDLDPRNVKQIILTHTHFDHTGGIKALANIVSPKLFLHEQETNNVENFGLSISKLHDGEIVVAGDHRLEVIHTPVIHRDQYASTIVRTGFSSQETLCFQMEVLAAQISPVGKVAT